MASLVRIGSRPSRLALAQAELVRRRLAALVPSAIVEIVPIRTSGDRMTAAALAEVGGKGLFVKELEQALADGRIDLAVHSMKDVPARLPDGFRIAAVPERADVRDALLTRAIGAAGSARLADDATLEALAPGARLGTSSVRRRFQALRLRRDLQVSALRGNVDTRLARLAAGDFDAIILALAGLARLLPAADGAVASARDGDDDSGNGVSLVELAPGLALAALDPREFVPCAGQGALCVEALADRPIAGSAELDAAVAVLDDPRAHLEITAERALLAGLGASCVSPIGVLARLETVTLAMRALVFSLDGARHAIDEISGSVADGEPGTPLERAAALGARLAARVAAADAGLMGPGDAWSASGAAGAPGASAPRRAPGVPAPTTALVGRTIAITRARAAGGGFAATLRARGATVVEFPTIELAPPESYEAIDAALAQVAAFDWVIFTSAAGVERAIERMKLRGLEPQALARAKLGAIGPATAERLRAHGLTVTAIPSEYRAEAIVGAIGVARIRGARILIPRAQRAREVLPEMLRAAGAAEVIVAPVYRTIAPTDAPVARVREMIAAGAIDLVTFTSSSTVTNFCAMVGEDLARRIKAAVIGPITAETARASGIEVIAAPRQYTIAALTEAIEEYFAPARAPGR